MAPRWAICLGEKALFATDDRDVVKRFAASGAFEVFDHKEACYISVLHCKQDAVDLLTQDDFDEIPRPART